MIDYSLVKELGFQRKELQDEVYKQQYGRECYYMRFFAVVMTMGVKHTITFEWDCDDRTVTVTKNETIFIAKFSDPETFKGYFKTFEMEEV